MKKEHRIFKERIKTNQFEDINIKKQEKLIYNIRQKLLKKSEKWAKKENKEIIDNEFSEYKAIQREKIVFVLVIKYVKKGIVKKENQITTFEKPIQNKEEEKYNIKTFEIYSHKNEIDIKKEKEYEEFLLKESKKWAKEKNKIITYKTFINKGYDEDSKSIIYTLKILYKDTYKKRYKFNLNDEIL